MYHLYSIYCSLRAFITCSDSHNLDRLAKRFMIGVIIADLIIIPASFLILTSSLRVLPAVAAVMTESTNSDPVTVGPATTKFLDGLKTDHLSPIVLKKVNRRPMTGDGRLVLLNNDNLQIFEYADHKSATDDASVFLKKYNSNTKKNQIRKKDMHIYTAGELVIFYLGTEKTILTILDEKALAFGQQSTKKNNDLTRVGN